MSAKLYARNPVLTHRSTGSAALATLLALAPAHAAASASSDSHQSAADELKQRAAALTREERHSEAARAWADFARREGLATDQHAFAALRTAASAKEAHNSGGNVESLCLARAVVDGYLERDDAVAAYDSDLRKLVAEVEQLLADAAGDDWRQLCAPAPTPSASPLQCRRGDRPGPARGNLADSSCEAPVLDPSVNKLTIAGVAATSFGGAALLGTAVSLIVAHKQVDELDELVIMKSENGGATPEMDAQAEQLGRDSEALESVAIALGVVGGASVVAGVVLFAVRHQRSIKPYAISPVASPRFAGLAVSGQF